MPIRLPSGKWPRGVWQISESCSGISGDSQGKLAKILGEPGINSLARIFFTRM